MPDQFWKLTPKEFYLMCEGYTERRQREWDEKQHELYLMRYTAATLHNIAAGFSQDAEGVKASDLMPLPLFDKKDKPGEIDKDHFKNIIKRDGKKWPHK